MLLQSHEIQEILPHRPPFLFVDRVTEVVPDTSITAEHLVSHSSPILQGHFPGNPILPGVIQVEAMAQAAIVLAHQSGRFSADKHHCFFMIIKEAKFRGPVVPGDVMRMEVKALRIGRYGRFEGQCFVGSDLKSHAVITAGFEPKATAETTEEG